MHLLALPYEDETLVLSRVPMDLRPLFIPYWKALVAMDRPYLKRGLNYTLKHEFGEQMFDDLCSVAVDSSGILWICDGRKIRLFSKQGEFIRIFADNHRFSRPYVSMESIHLFC